MNDTNAAGGLEIEALLDEARAIVAGDLDQRPTALHLWAALAALDGDSDQEPPPTAFGQRRLPLALH